MARPLVLARFEGALLGTMVGDSLGARVNGITLGPLRHRYPDETAFLAIVPGRYGAATEMTAAVAVSLSRFPELNPADLAAELVRGASLDRGYGQGTAAALARLREGEHWRTAGVVQSGRASFGNGAAVRSAPIGLVYARDVEQMRWVAEEAASVTHSNALAVEGAVLAAAAVGLAALGAASSVAGPDFLLKLGAETQMREYRSRYESAARMVERDVDPTRIVDVLGNGQAALGSVVTAAFCFAKHPDDFARATALALSLGGNASSIVAMTGAVSGARLGPQAVPSRWVEKLEREPLSADRMRGLAADLLSAAKRAG